MENSEIQQNQMPEKSELVLSKESLKDLTETRKWTMFFAILGFVFIGFMLIGAIAMGMISLIGGTFAGFGEAYILGIIAIVYLALGVLYFFPVLYLLKFSTNMKAAIEQTEQNKLVLAFENLKSHYRFVGILTIVIISLYILLGIVFVFVGLASIF